MAASYDIMTIPDLRKAIKSCDLVLTKIRFGVSEREVKLSKKEALDFVDGITDDTTPASFEMYCGRFGFVDGDNQLYLG